MESLQSFLFASDFMPHGFCYLWNPRILWLHVISDGLIASSYYCIPIILVYFIRKNRDLPFHRIFWMFGSFVLACGTTHLLEIWNVWHGSYLMAGVIKAITAGVSVLTAAMLIPWAPRIVSLPSRVCLQEVNRKLQQEMAERVRAEQARRRLAAIVESSDDAIISKTLDGTITAWNHGAANVFGYAPAEAVGKSMHMLLPPDCVSEEAEILSRIGRGESVVHFETARVRKDGKRIDISVTISPIKDDNGAIVGASKIARDITERKLKEEQLRESEERFRLFIEHAPAALAMFDREMRYLHVSRRWRTDYGLGERELRGVSQYEIFPDMPERWKDVHRRALAGEVLRAENDRFDRADGSVQWTRWEARPWLDPRGGIAGIVVFAEDITERILAEEATRESEERFHAMLNGIPQLAWMAAPDGNIFWYNQRWYDYTGTTAGEMEGGGWQGVHDPQTLPQVLERWKGSIATGASFEMEFPLRAADGHFGVFLTRVMPLQDANGGVVRWFGTNTDISERKEAEVRLAGQAEELSRQAEELTGSRHALESQTLMLQSVLNSMTEGLAAVDERGNFVLWNTAAEKILGMGATDLPSQEWAEHYGLFLNDTVTTFPPDQIPLVRAVRGEVSTTEMFVRNSQLAEGAWIEVSAGPLKDRQGAVRGGVAAFRDITQSRADEREIRKLNDELEIRVLERTAQLEAANKELEAFSYSVSHDLRAPLRHISGFSQILMEEFGATLDPSAKHYLDRIQAGTQKMGVLVDELLNLARVGRHAIKRQTTRLNPVVEEVVAMLQEESEGRQVKWIVSDLPVVGCDAVLVKQVFQNLLANALKFTRPRAQAVIEVGLKDSHLQEKAVGQPIFMVRDNGIGFSMKYAGKLFGVFQRLHLAQDFEGTGIGLATVQRIVQKHGGRVWAEGEIDQGATFYFTLGAEREAEAKRNGAAAGGQ